MDMNELINHNLIVKHLAGSHAYGTNIETSDIDVRGIFYANPINVRTPFFPVKEVIDSNEEDTKYYELNHFMKLCLECNPNILETLWVDESDVIYSTPAYELLRENRERFLSSKVAFTFTGYMMSQLKRIKGHNKWINNPQPKTPPKQQQYFQVIQWFGTEKRLKIDLLSYNNDHYLHHYGDDIYGVYKKDNHTLFNADGSIRKYNYQRPENETPIMLVKFNKDMYVEHKTKHTNYWKWKENRNKSRSELEERFGYDTKHAMHLIRLGRMGIEVLTNQEVIVKRPDADELLEIRDGKLTYDELVNYATSIHDEVINKLYKTTNLPKTPDLKFAAQIIMDVQDMCWEN